MDDWKSDSALGVIAHSLGQKVVQMYHSNGIPIPRTYFDPQGPTKSSPSPDAEATFRRSFVLDAEDFTSMDPQKIIDEYQRMQKAADATDSDNSDAVRGLRLAQSKIAANWHGAAADAFAGQMTAIEQFMEQQQERLAYAMQAMGTAFGLAVQFRQSYHELATSAVAACDAVIAERPAEPSVNSFMMALGRQMVGIGVGALGAKNPKDLLKVGIEKFKEAFDGAKERDSIEGNAAPEVLGSYLSARDRLRGELEAGLGHLRNWLDGQRSAYFSLNVPILEPLPAYTDIRSPDFSYGKFFNDGHDPNTYTPKVEQERKESAEANPSPEGPIHRRLKGEE